MRPVLKKIHQAVDREAHQIEILVLWERLRRCDQDRAICLRMRLMAVGHRSEVASESDLVLRCDNPEERTGTLERSIHRARLKSLKHPREIPGASLWLWRIVGLLTIGVSATRNLEPGSAG